MRRYKLKRILLLLFLPITFFIRIFAKNSPLIVEKYYSNGIYSLLAPAINVITSFFTFSIAEYIIYIGVIFIFVFIIRFILRLMSLDGEERKYAAYVGIINIFVTASIAFFIFTMSFGLNYFRVPFVDSIDLKVDTYSKEDLIDLSEKLTEDVNYYRNYVMQDENGVMILSRNMNETADAARQCMNIVSHDFRELSGMYQQPKGIKTSPVLSRLGITGFFFPVTFEANINIDAPDYSIPFTMMHELAHVRGYMQEEEANFISYLSCMSVDDVEFKYSASLEALIYTLNALAKADKEKYNEIYGTLSDKVVNDLKNKSAYWKFYDGNSRKMADHANDIYLKANDQETGRKSYGMMVDLLIAYNKTYN